MIEAYDQHGNKVLIERQEYRTHVLPGIFKEAWTDADRLYDAIVMALNEGFLAETVTPAERLRAVDPIGERSATILGIVLMKYNELSRAEQSPGDYLKEQDSGVVATNLAKVYEGLDLVQACIESHGKHDGLRISDDLLSLNRYDLKQIIDERRGQLTAMHENKA